MDGATVARALSLLNETLLTTILEELGSCGDKRRIRKRRPLPERLAVEQVGLAHDIVRLLDDLVDSPAPLAGVVTGIREYERTVLRENTFRGDG